MKLHNAEPNEQKINANVTAFRLTFNSSSIKTSIIKIITESVKMHKKSGK
jgi:hypothetical protein